MFTEHRESKFNCILYYLGLKMDIFYRISLLVSYIFQMHHVSTCIYTESKALNTH